MRYSLLAITCITLAIFFNSCDKESDKDDECTVQTWYQDADGDGLGNPDESVENCEQPTGFVANSDDPDDTVCTLQTWYEDADGDGLGNPAVSQESCTQPTGYVSNSDDDDDTVAATVIIDVDDALFLAGGLDQAITTVACTLSDGTVTMCYQIVSTSTPPDHDMGPWCPDNISDDASKGGIWLENGQVYDVDGAFVQNMATFYSDNTWLMYDGNGDIYTTETLTECQEAANPNVGAQYQNFCVECLPSYVTGLTQTYTIPVTPVMLDVPYTFAMGPGGPGGGGISQRGVAFNGVVFDAPAPTDAILGAYTLAPFDDAGGHINLNAGYHYHAATGISTEIAQTDGHAPMIGYALDGHGMYAQTDDQGVEPTDLDACRGHYDTTRGYHYHVAAAGSNSFINCLSGAYAN